MLQLNRLKGKDYSFADYFEAIIDKRPEVVQIITVEDDKHYTLQAIEEKANRIAHWALSIGVKKGDSVGLLMLNRYIYK